MAALDGAGWSAADAADADVIIVNSCGFIESAKQESINAVLLWRRQYPEKKILLAGCLSQRYANELAESLPEVDAFFGVEDISKITEKANSIVGSGGAALPHRGMGNGGIVSTSLRPLLSLPGSAYVKISEGCNNRCSFCAIPLIRGPLHCRSVADIVEECRGLLARGIRELCVIGQDIGSYHSDGSGLPELLAAIAGLPGDFWLRLLYMHPDHFPLPVLDLMERDSRVLPYFDIPFQHASPAILAAMNRKGSAESYIALADTIRERLPRAVIRSTFLVGFPGETDADFAALLDFQHKLRPDWLGCFAYSREEDTPAYSMKGQVPKKTAAARKREIEDRQIVIAEQNVDRFVGQNLDVLVEERFGGSEDAAGGSEDAADSDLWLGRLYCHAPEVDGAAVVVCEGGVAATGIANSVAAGQVLPCRVIARRGIDLEVRLKD